MPEANLFLEKRVHPRVSVKIPVKYRLVENLEGIRSVMEIRKNETQTHSLDVSLGGMFIETEEKLEKGHILSLDISVPGNPRKISAFAEVVWAKESGAGLHFMLIKNEHLESLKAFLEKAPSS